MLIGNLYKRQAGFTYLIILFVIAVAGVMLTKTGIYWSQINQREKERELLFVGNQYRQAIALYYERTPATAKRFPTKLEDMISDSRFNPPKHYLRKVYLDPILSRKQWGTVTAPDGGIMGVYSLSDTPPIKKTNFSYLDRAFDGGAKYSDWKFIYMPLNQLLSSSGKRE